MKQWGSLWPRQVLGPCFWNSKGAPPSIALRLLLGSEALLLVTIVVFRSY